LGLCGGNGVVHHGQNQLGPAAVAGGVNGVHDDGAALGGCHHVVAVHGVAANPHQAPLSFRGLFATTAQCAHRPARLHQLPCHFATNAAGGAQYQCCFAVHLITPKKVAMEEVCGCTGY
jgi:hypothetical protein